MAERVPRVCPTCDHDARTLLYPQRFVAFASDALLDGYDVVACERCGMVYADGIPEQQAFDAYYAAMSKYEYADRDGRESPYDLARFAAMADAVRPSLRESDTVVDIGCATGGLLEAFRTRGIANVHGVDPSPACARAAERLYGIPVGVGTIAALPPLPESIQLITLVGVVEHLRDVREALRVVRDALAPDGLLFVEVPDAEGFGSHPGPPFQEFSVEHVNFLSALGTQNLLAAAGFETVWCRRTAREWAPASIAPVVYGLFRRTDAAVPITPDQSARDGVSRYVAEGRADEALVAARLDAALPPGTQCIVWGAGTHTQRLFATGVLSVERVALIVDGNPHYRGRSIGGVPISAPSAVATRSEPVLISTRTYQEEIATQLRDTLRLPNALIRLYDVG
ncbi:MAG: class I SAM-dependent methyltransferase [Gemmatimonadaceae bacterium]|nr:class I SAM-dependent methyltransferase [Gemmatimonadaceae bacterium]